MPTEFELVTRYVEDARTTVDLEELRLLTVEAIRALGVDFFAILHHLDLEFPIDAIVRFGNYPEPWKEIVAEKRFFVDDPVWAACQKTVVGFRWGEVPSLIEMSAHRQEVFDAALKQGLGDGYTLPVRAPGEFEGSCSFVCRPGKEFPLQAIPALHYLGCYAFEAARRIVRVRLSRGLPPLGPQLSDRQMDCIVLAAKGNSASVSGQLLGISQYTVQEYLADAKERYGVRTTMQLIVRSLFDSKITFADLLKDQ